jgi:hypothetical protein
MLKPTSSKVRGPPGKVYSFLNTVIGISHLCCHNVLYFLNNLSVIFLAQLHSIFCFMCMLCRSLFVEVPDLDKERP